MGRDNFEGEKRRPIVKYKGAVLDGGSDPPWDGAILKGEGRWPVVKYSDYLPSAVQNGSTNRDAV